MSTSKKTAADDVADGIRSILDRIGEFFHIFDLSFFVAGAVTSGALTFLYFKSQATWAFPLPGWVSVVGTLVAIYTAGLMSFTIGRHINGRLFRGRKFPVRFQIALMKHQASGPELAKYLTDNDEDLWWLYLRMWQDIAFERPKSVAYTHLSRYWVMAATFDGLAASFIIWAAVSLLVTSKIVTPNPLSISWGIAAAVGFLALSVTALKQGADYYAYQIDDLVAAALSAKSPAI